MKLKSISIDRILCFFSCYCGDLDGKLYCDAAGDGVGDVW